MVVKTLLDFIAIFSLMMFGKCVIDLKNYEDWKDHRATVQFLTIIIVNSIGYMMLAIAGLVGWFILILG